MWKLERFPIFPPKHFITLLYLSCQNGCTIGRDIERSFMNG